MIKDKELREIMYNACKEFDEKLEFIYEQLEQLERYGAIDLPRNVFLEHTNPFDKRLWFGDINKNWRTGLKKTECKDKY